MRSTSASSPDSRSGPVARPSSQEGGTCTTSAVGRLCSAFTGFPHPGRRRLDGRTGGPPPGSQPGSRSHDAHRRHVRFLLPATGPAITTACRARSHHRRCGPREHRQPRIRRPGELTGHGRARRSSRGARRQHRRAARGPSSCRPVRHSRNHRARSPADHSRAASRVPQGKQIHGLLTGGQRVLEELLPGLTAELAADGAPVVDALADMRLSFNGHRLRQATSGLTHVSASRPLLEHRIRERTRSVPNISIVDATEVIDVVGRDDRVTGVRVLRRGGRRVEDVDADLVVDACGRGSRTSEWLTALGYPTPPVERIPIDLGYTTRRFHLPAGLLDGDVGVLHSPTPGQPRGAALARLENRHLDADPGRRAGRPPARRIDGFAAFAASVDCNEIHTAVRDGEPIDNPIFFRFPASVRRRYEHVRLPRNLIVLGDSLCSFNPVYGQGMTVAALEAHALRDGLSRDLDTSQPVMASLARIVDVPWQLAKAADRPFLTPAQTSRHNGTVLDRYVERVLIAATHDPAAGRAFLRVSGLLDPPRALLRPRPPPAHTPTPAALAPTHRQPSRRPTRTRSTPEATHPGGCSVSSEQPRSSSRPW